MKLCILHDQISSNWEYRQINDIKALEKTLKMIKGRLTAYSLCIWCHAQIQTFCQSDHPLTKTSESMLTWFQHVYHMPRSQCVGITLNMCPANERRCYIATLSFIGWAYIQNDPWCVHQEQNYVMALHNTTQKYCRHMHAIYLLINYDQHFLSLLSVLLFHVVFCKMFP